MAVLTYENPQAQVKIWNRTTQAWTHLDVTESPFLQSVQINLKEGGIPTVTVAIEAPYERGIELFGDSLLAGGSSLAARIGYPSQEIWTPWMYTLLQNGGSGLRNTPNSIAGSIVGMVGGRADKVITREKGKPRKEGGDFIDVVRRIRDMVPKMGTGFDLDLGPDAESRLSRLEVLSTSRLNKTEELDYYLDKVSATRFIRPVDSGKSVMVIRTRADISEQRISRTFVHRGNFESERAVYPSLDFTVEQGTAAEWQLVVKSPGAATTTTVGIDPETGAALRPQEITGQVSGDAKLGHDFDLNPTMSDKSIMDSIEEVFVDRLLDKVNEVGDLITIDKLSKALEVESYQQRLRLVGGLRAQLTSLGLPQQYPFDRIKIVGQGKIYDGVWEVREVTHTFSAGDYRTMSKLISVGINATEQKEEVPSRGSGKNDPAPEREAGN